MKASLPPAVERWHAQYVNVRSLEARLDLARSLHDRLIIVDGRTAWILTQSLNAFARRAPATIVRSDEETSRLKVDAYQQIWENAAVLA
ncbi:hypothetical protein GCM10011335_53500 [Aureimonas glaciei]|uniref:Phospholipase D-like domain-containing protein n=1 Tax=Aureimonas glaciei TaxID=1776957 RepID=A0A916YH07_9HYPH|nr:hypothetical protein GCM10011335_53500 [Aureimonas glaciei]